MRLPLISARERVVVLLFLWATAPTVAFAGSVDDIKTLQSLWRQHAPLCVGYPSSEHCEDGDMTLFNGLLCHAGDQLGCDGVKNAQDATGRWHRSPRLAANPSPRSGDSFSWDMALGMQLYAVKTGDKASLKRWIDWVEVSRPCLVSSPEIAGNVYCLVRGWPRWCTDDTEKGCTAKPQHLATLVRTLDTLKVAPPAAATDAAPPGPIGDIVRRMQEEERVREANAALSLGTLMEKARGLQPAILLTDSLVNREGYSRHLVGVEILLARALGLGTEDVTIAATVMGLKEKGNPFFQYLWEGSTERVRQQFLALAPKSAQQIPAEKKDWVWQRSEDHPAWKEPNLWDFQFLGRLLTKPP